MDLLVFFGLALQSVLCLSNSVFMTCVKTVPSRVASRYFFPPEEPEVNQEGILLQIYASFFTEFGQRLSDLP